MTTTGSLLAEERRARILAALSDRGTVTLDVIAQQLGVSSMTVRRDLDQLEAIGALRRVRGGAIAVPGPRPFGERRTVNSRAKETIASKALELVPGVGAIAIDASTTSGTLASQLAGRDGLTVATNSYENFASLRAASGPTPVLVGGESEPETGSFVGQLAVDAATSLLYRVFFVSASAVDLAHGTSEVSIAESQVKRAFASRADAVVLCVDSTKLGARAVAPALSFAQVGVMITELDPHDARLDPYRDVVELR
jgi:DeoR/GlpR family transcriptional regulator of sugar metabolism